MKRGPKLNLIINFGEGGGGGGVNPTTLTVSSLLSEFLAKKLNLIKNWGKGMGSTETKTVCQTVSNEVKYKNATIYTM